MQRSPRNNPQLLTLSALLACGLLVLSACGDDSGKSPGGSLGRKDSGADAAVDAATGSGGARPPPPEQTDAGRDAGRPPPPSIEPPPPPPVVDIDSGEPSCDDVDCRPLSDDCNVGVCDEATLDCSAMPVADDTPCGSSVLDNCTLPDRCKAGACLPRHQDSGTPCGDQSVVCRNNDACDGDGNCIDNGLLDEGTPCGNLITDTECDKPDSCDALGVCSPNFALPDAPCGDTGVSCRVDDTCDGSGSCTDNGNKQNDSPCGSALTTFCHPTADHCQSGTCVLGNTPDDTPCGITVATDPECDLPDRCQGGVCDPRPLRSGLQCGNQGGKGYACDGKDTCDGGGTCSANYMPEFTPCGVTTPGECEQPETCDADGDCLVRYKNAGAPCGDQNKQCRINDACNASGVCVDGGITSPCAITGKIYVGGANPPGITVSVPSEGLSTVTDANGDFVLNMPLYKDILVQVQAQPGYYGLFKPFNFTPDNAVYGAMIQLPSDAAVEAAAPTRSLTVDQAKAVLRADFQGAIALDDGVMLSAVSALPIAQTPTGFVASTTLTATGTALHFFNVVGSSTTVTPTSGSSVPCKHIFPGISAWTLAPHTVTEVPIACQ
jgi:hypothetical protein